MGKRAGLLVLALGIIIAGCMAPQESAKLDGGQAVAATPAVADAAKLIAGYSKWDKALPKPVKMEAYVAAMCRRPTPEHDPDNPHDPKFLTVFLNPKAKAAFFATPPRPYEEGSVIVKEKLDNVTDTKPMMLTVMVKGKKGSSPDSGDWQFFTASGEGKLDAKANNKPCMSCHTEAKDRDYVFGDYMKLAKSG